MQSLAEMAEFAYVTALAAGDAILPHFRRPIDVENKDRVGGYDPVTVADRAAETAIRASIATAFPTHGVFGEEHGRESGTEPWTWVIDPIDGTKSFILGQLHWGTLIALNDGTRPVVGVALPAVRGRGVRRVCGRPGAMAARNASGARWRHDGARDTRTHSSSPPILATSRPPREAAAFAAITDGARFTRYGGDLYCYTQLAMGLCDVVIETGLQPYDVQALIPLIEAAGGVISDWQGGPCDEGGDVLACGDPSLHARLLERLAG